MSTTTRVWRGVPPEGEPIPEHLQERNPEWREEHNFTLADARRLLTEHYGPDWTLEQQTTHVTDWRPIEGLILPEPS